jgi:hypothetical protein
LCFVLPWQKLSVSLCVFRALQFIDMILVLRFTDMEGVFFTDRKIRLVVHNLSPNTFNYFMSISGIKTVNWSANLTLIITISLGNTVFHESFGISIYFVVFSSRFYCCRTSLFFYRTCNSIKFYYNYFVNTRDGCFDFSLYNFFHLMVLSYMLNRF